MRKTPLLLTSTSSLHQQPQQQLFNVPVEQVSVSSKLISSSLNVSSSSTSLCAAAPATNLNANILNGKIPKTIVVSATPSLSSGITTLNNVDQASSGVKSNVINNDSEAPPIPPRSSKSNKSTMMGHQSNDFNRPQKSSPSVSKNNSTETNEINGHQQPPQNCGASQIETSQNIKVNNTVPTAQFIKSIRQPDEDDDTSDDDSNPICGPAETISGVIDTRPIDQRTNYVSFASLTNNLTTNFNLITVSSTQDSTASVMTLASKEQAVKDDFNKASNTYLMKSNQTNNINNNQNNLSNGTTVNNHNNHQRHMSVPVSGTQTIVKALPSSPSTFQASISQKMPNISSPMKSTTSQCANTSSLTANIKASPRIRDQKLYENIKMKSAGNLISLNNLNNNNSNSSSSSNVSYENINLEYINRLMKEGYSKENVMAALCISRNNYEMACDILHEFVSTENSKVCDEDNR